MDFKNWINKNLSEIQDSLEYGKYFDSIVLQEEVDEGYTLFNPELGIDLILRDDRSIRAVHLYSETHAQNKAKMFAGPLPFELKFTYSRDECREILGVPTITGGGDFNLLYGITPDWDKYIYDDYYLHLTFTKKNRIDLVTLGCE